METKLQKLQRATARAQESSKDYEGQFVRLEKNYRRERIITLGYAGVALLGILGCISTVAYLLIQP